MHRTLGLVILFLIGSAQAAPVQLAESEFAAGVSGFPVIVEDFESFDAGFEANPLYFENGRVSNYVDTTNPYWSGPRVTGGSLCGTPDDQCLITNWGDDLIAFDLFPPGTTHWSADMYFVHPSNIIEVIVTGGSGVLSFQGVSSEFYGFSDSLGLTNISFQNLTGTGNYSFDNITTTSVPVPAAVWLFGSALGGLGWLRRKQAS
jgi:hypothetical protein